MEKNKMKSVAFTLAVLLATLNVVQATEQTAEQALPVDGTQPVDTTAAPGQTEEQTGPAQN